jgi:serine/threonine protein kinase
LRDYFVSLSAFEAESMINESHQPSSQIYHRVDELLFVVVKSALRLKSVETLQMENLINLRHPCIAAPIGFVFPIESGSLQEMKIVEWYSQGCSLAEVLSVRPVWWTSTVKAKAIVGIVLGLRFAHSHGLLHGSLTTRNILFDLDHCIQIVNFNAILLDISENKGEEGTRVGGFSGDVHAFASILFEIMVGRRPTDEISVPSDIPAFVSKMITTGLSLKSETRYSFHDIFEILKKNYFRLGGDVSSAEVLAFVKFVESAEQPEK